MKRRSASVVLRVLLLFPLFACVVGQVEAADGVPHSYAEGRVRFLSDFPNEGERKTNEVQRGVPAVAKIGPRTSDRGASGAAEAFASRELQVIAHAYVDILDPEALQTEGVLSEAVAFTSDKIAVLGEFKSFVRSARFYVQVSGHLRVQGLVSRASVSAELGVTKPEGGVINASMGEELMGAPGVDQERGVNMRLMIQVIRPPLADNNLFVDLRLTAGANTPSQSPDEVVQALSSFAHTMELLSVNFYDADGVLIPGLTVQSDLGVDYPVNAIPSLPEPELSIRRIEPDKLRLSWPATFGGFVLQENTAIVGGTWKDHLRSPQVRDGENRVEILLPLTTRFYRLQ